MYVCVYVYLYVCVCVCVCVSVYMCCWQGRRVRKETHASTTNEAGGMYVYVYVCVCVRVYVVCALMWTMWVRVYLYVSVKVIVCIWLSCKVILHNIHSCFYISRISYLQPIKTRYSAHSNVHLAEFEAVRECDHSLTYRHSLTLVYRQRPCEHKRNLCTERNLLSYIFWEYAFCADRGCSFVQVNIDCVSADGEIAISVHQKQEKKRTTKRNRHIYLIASFEYKWCSKEICQSVPKRVNFCAL